MKFAQVQHSALNALLECMLMIMVFAKNAQQHVRHVMDQVLINVMNALMVSINKKVANIVHNVQVVVLNVIQKVFAHNAVNITTKDHMETVSDVMNHAEIVKETQIIASYADLDTTSMAKNADHVIQTAKNVME